MTLKKYNFNLISFDSINTPKIYINSNVFRNNNLLNIGCLLQENLSTILIPPDNNNYLRQYDLWEHTCFEFFLKLKGTTEYWEFNLSPSKNWNVFHFLDYRLNIVEEKAFDSLPFNVSQEKECLAIEINLDLNILGIAEQDLDIAIACVVENKDKQLSYWALNHPPLEADFHHQDGFIINV